MLWLLPLCVPYLGDVTRWELRAWPTSILKIVGWANCSKSAGIRSIRPAGLNCQGRSELTTS
jgi:hypothetical protein